MLILIVDDDRDARGMMSELLVDDGYEISAAADWRDTMSFLHRRLPDVILLDLMLPQVSGFDILQALKSHHKEAYRRIPVVVITAIGESMRAWAKSAGAAAYLSKPFTIDELLSTIARTVDRPAEIAVA